MIETLQLPIVLNAVTVNVDDPQQVRTVTHRVAGSMSPEVCAALREFLANVREHCSTKEVDIVELPSVLIEYDHGGGIINSQTHKPEGEGGYGLGIMHALGAEVRRWEKGTMFIMPL
jgi:nitrate/nitrite-specific signal transduction histidine kinase